MATFKQQKAISHLLETGGNVRQAMLKAGYTDRTAINPQKLTKSKAFRDMLEKKLPNNHLLKRHREFLDAPRLVRTYKKGDLETETEETDPMAVKALDMAYKLKGFYSETLETTRPITINVIKFDGQPANNNPAPFHTKTISITVPSSDGQGEASGNSVASPERKG